MFGPAQYAVAKAVADCVAEARSGRRRRRPGDRLRRLHSPGRRGQRQDPQVQLRGDQALDPSAMKGLPTVRNRCARRTRSSTRSPADPGRRLIHGWPWPAVARTARSSAVSLIPQPGGRPPMPSTKPKILVQLDTDPQPSVFDAVVAVDAGVDHLLRHGGVTPGMSATWSTGPCSPRGRPTCTARRVFVGGSDVSAGEAVLEAVKRPSSGRSGSRSYSTPTGPTPRRPPRRWRPLWSSGGTLQGLRRFWGRPGRSASGSPGCWDRLGAEVSVGSRGLDRACATADVLQASTGRTFTPFATGTPEELPAGSPGPSIVVAAAASGVTLLLVVLKNLPDLKCGNRPERRSPSASRGSRRPTKTPSGTGFASGGARSRRDQDEDPQARGARAL